MRIIMPQALVNALPNLCNLTVNLIKASSLAFIMTAKDITAIARIEASFGYNYIEAYIVIFVMYIILCSLTQLLFNMAETRAGRYRAAASTRTSRFSLSRLFITAPSEVKLNA
jgi:L-cystine transport system permease protein